MISGLFEVVEAYSLKGGLICALGDISDPNCECEGGITQLTLQYAGASDEPIIVTGKGKKNKKTGEVEAPIIFYEDGVNDIVTADGIFTINGFGKKGTLGSEIYIYVGDTLNTKIHTSCSQPIGPGLISGDFEVLEGYSREGGLLCDMETPPPSDDCACEGKVSELTLRYNGLATADIVVMRKIRKKDDPDEGVVFTGTVEPGAEFTFVGNDKKGTFGTEISIYVDDQLNTKIHTSCSQPIGPGLISGLFEVVEGYSRNGGLLCPL
jgi:hypothetical protein